MRGADGQLTAFTHPKMKAPQAVGVLTGMGFSFDAPQPVRVVVLDTFDDAIRSRGLRLALQGRPPYGLVLVDQNTRRVLRADVETMPSRVAELPDGPLREAVASAVKDRALLPVVTVRADRSDATRPSHGVQLTFYDAIEISNSEQPGAWVAELATGATDDVRGELARHGFVLDEQRDWLDAAGLRAGVVFALAHFSPSVPLSAGDDAFGAVRRVLLNLLTTAEANIAGAVDDLDDEFLHQLRVALRRTRSVMGHARALLPRQARRLELELRWLARSTSEARDLDVQTTSWPKLVAPLTRDEASALDPVGNELRAERNAAHAVLAHDLLSARSHALRSEWRAWLTDPSVHGRRSEPVGTFARKRIRKAQKRLVREGRAIKADSPAAEVHELRKTAKELRYLLECFSPLIDPKLRKRFVRRLKSLQDNLGAHQDAEVQLVRLNLISDALRSRGELPEPTEAALANLRASIDRRRATERADFADRFGTYTRRKNRRLFRALLRSIARD